MPQPSHPVRIEEIDWRTVFPFINLFKTFRMAIGPAKLLLALVLVAALFFYGCLLDFILKSQAEPGEAQYFATHNINQFDHWREHRPQQVEQLQAEWIAVSLPNNLQGHEDPIEAINQYFHNEYTRLARNGSAADNKRLHQLRIRHRQKLAQIQALNRVGAFSAASNFGREAFSRLVHAAISFNFGLQDLATRNPVDTNTVTSALRDILCTLPSWLYHSHRLFFILWISGSLLLWALFGGAICRLAAMHGGRDKRLDIAAALRFSQRKFPWLVIAPFLPLFMVILIGLCQALFGLIMFNVPVLDLFGGLLFGLVLIAGFIITLMILGLIGSANLLYPALAVEGTDAFDVIARTFNYVFFRPWRFLFYNLVSLVYGAITYCFVAMVAWMTLAVTQRGVGLGVFTSAKSTAHGRFAAMMPPLEPGQLISAVDWSLMDGTAKVAAILITAWTCITFALVAAFIVSFFFCANTWIYFLLRHVSDGTSFDDIDIDQPAETNEGDAPQDNTASPESSGITS